MTRFAPRLARQALRSVLMLPLAAGLTLTGFGCAGSDFNVTRGGGGKVGTPAKQSRRGGQSGQPEDGARCPAQKWSTHESAHGLFALQYPASWNVSTQSDGRFVAQHPDGSMQFTASAAWLPGALTKVPTLRAQRFAESEPLSPWTRREHTGGYLLEGILQQGNQVVIARYLVTDDRYLEATLTTNQAFDDGCRKVAVRSMSSLQLRDQARPDVGEKRAPAEPSEPAQPAHESEASEPLPPAQSPPPAQPPKAADPVEALDLRARPKPEPEPTPQPPAPKP